MSGNPIEGKDVPLDAKAELDDAIHTLAQPLTALFFAVDMAAMQDVPEAWKEALEKTRTECRRAKAALEQVREAAARIPGGEQL